MIQESVGKDFPQIIFPLLHERNVHLAGENVFYIYHTSF